MKISTKVFLIIFLINSIIFGPIMILGTYYFEGKIVSIKDIILTISFSAISAAVYVNGKIHLRKYRNKPLCKEDFKILSFRAKNR